MGFIPFSSGGSSAPAPAPAAKGFIPWGGGSSAPTPAPTPATPPVPVPSPAATTTPPPQNQQNATPPAGEGSAPVATTTPAVAPTISPTMAPSPATTTMQYFTGDGYGFSPTNTDPYSGKPLLTYKGQLLSDRTAMPFDFTKAQPITKDMLYNARMPYSVSQAIRQELGASAYQELDHIMPLELGGSNNKLTNLRLENGQDPSKPYSPSTNPTPTDPLENQLADQVYAGKISLLDAWIKMAQAKGVTLPDAKSQTQGFWGNLWDGIKGFASSVSAGTDPLNELGKSVDEGIGATVTHPVEALGGVVKGTADVFMSALSGGASLVGAKGFSKYVSDNQDAVNQIFESNMKDQSAETAGQVGQFVGQQIPYILGGEAAGLAGEAASKAGILKYGGSLTAAQISLIGKVTKIASNVIGFTAVNQLTMKPGSTGGERLTQLRNDVLVLGTLEGLGAGLDAYKNAKWTAQARTFLDTLKSKDTSPEAISSGLAAVTKEIKDETGKTPQDLLADVSKTHEETTPVTPPPIDKKSLNAAIAKKEAMSSNKGVTLASGFNPGLDKFIESDIKPVVSTVKEGVSEIAGGVNPQGASPAAQNAADIIRNAKASIANLADLERYDNKPFMDFFKKESTNEGVANISEYERTGNFKNAPEGYSEFYKKSIDSSRAVLQQAYGNDRVGYVENYVRRMFQFGSKADEDKATSYLLNQFTGSLSATKSPLRGRVLDMPLDEALADMKARGIKVSTVSTNPEELRQWSVANARQALYYRQVWDQAKDSGLITFVRNGGEVPKDFVPLDDRAAKVFAPGEVSFPGGQGSYTKPIEMGKYYANPKVSRVFDNTISKGLGGSPTFRTLRVMENQMNFLQLGISGFHFTGTAINAGVSDLSLGFRQLMNGDVRQGIGSLGRGIVPFYSFTRDAIKGNDLIKGLQQGSPEAYAFLKEKLNPAGGRLTLDAHYRGTMADNMMKAFRDQNYVSGMIRVPGAVIETVAKPLMSFAIPRVKIGAFMDLADQAVKNLPEDATPEMRQRALASAWDSIDNRFGQLVYDNLFWNKTGKDLLMLGTRSLGWNLGTLRELGGGITDFASQTLRGKGVTDKTLYTLALPIYVGMIGAAYQYLHTGKGPSSLKDYFYPQNGLTTKNGDPDRTSLPTYMKDVYAYGNNPFATIAHKSSPLLDTVQALATNQDYYGNLIANPGDPAALQLEQRGRYIVNNLLPFSIQQSVLSAQAGGPEQAVENFFGFTKAPGAITQTPQEAALNQKLLQTKGPMAPQTPEQQVINQRKADARAAILKGDYSLLDQLIKDGIITQKGRAKFIKDAKLSPQQRKINLLPKNQRQQFESTSTTP